LSLCVSLCRFSARSVANSLSQSVHTCGLELLSHAGSVVYASFFVSCKFPPTKSALKSENCFSNCHIKCTLASVRYATKVQTQNLDNSSKDERLLMLLDFLAGQFCYIGCHYVLLLLLLLLLLLIIIIC